jgi:undecaprenyl-diphosphatase
MKARDKRLWEWMSLSLLLGLVAAIGSLIFFSWLSDEVLRGETRAFDDATRAAVHAWASPSLTVFMQIISFMGSTEFLFGATTVATFLMFRSKWKKEAILFPITMIGAGLLNTTLKLSFQRARPVPFFDLLAPRSYSFPSGHALASFCFYGVLAAMLATRIKNQKWRAVFWTSAVLIILLIGLSRIYLGVHYTTDVLAGYAAALIWVVVVNFVEQRLAARRRKRSKVQ